MRWWFPLLCWEEETEKPGSARPRSWDGPCVDPEGRTPGLSRGCGRLCGQTVPHTLVFSRVAAKGLRWFFTKPSSVLVSPSFLCREPAGQLTMLSGNAGTERSG